MLECAPVLPGLVQPVPHCRGISLAFRMGEAMRAAAIRADVPLLGSWSEGSEGALDRKRIVLIIRSVVIATAAYFVLTGGAMVRFDQLLYVAMFAGSNLALSLAPRRLFDLPQFGAGLLLADMGFILFSLTWGHGASQELLLVYFFTIFLTTVGGTVGQVAVGSALIAGVYGYWLWATGTYADVPEAWVRLPFFFLVAVFYAFLIERLKKERNLRREAEAEKQHLRLLLDLAAIFSEKQVTRELVHGIGRFVEMTCPGLRCSVALHPLDTGRGQAGETFLVRAHGESYGILCVKPVEARELDERERWLCEMVSQSAAVALYAADQSDAAKVASETKDLFLANVSHEFRTPLHAILGYAEVLGGMTPPGADPMFREGIERMRANAVRLQDLLEELLSFAEIRAGRRTMRIEPVSLRAVVDDLVPVTRELIAGKAVALSWQIDTEADEVRTDRRKLQRILSCLLSNAAKFTEKGSIHISVSAVEEGRIEVAISDTGIGISEDDLSLVFDDFRQVDPSFTRRYGGLGLGLALARELVRLLGGTMELESRAGVGTTVRVRVPRQPPEGVTRLTAKTRPTKVQADRDEPSLTPQAASA
jgi:signal transduction histidine kinase